MTYMNDQNDQNGRIVLNDQNDLHVSLFLVLVSMQFILNHFYSF